MDIFITFQTIYGSETERSRWRDCVSYVNDNMGNAVGRLFVSKHFDENAKKSVSTFFTTLVEQVTLSVLLQNF